MDRRKASLVVVMMAAALTAVSMFCFVFIDVFLGPEQTITGMLTTPVGAGVVVMLFGMLAVMGLGLVHIIIKPT